MGDPTLTGGLVERSRREVDAPTRSKRRKGYLLLDRVALDPDPRVATPTRSPAPRTDRSTIDTGGDDFWL